MEEIVKLLDEERNNIEALIAKNQDNASVKEIALLQNKLSKIGEIEQKVRQYNAIK